MDSDSNAWRGMIMMLLYYVMFEEDPFIWIDEVVDRFVWGNTQDMLPEEFRAAIDHALKSDLPLVELLPRFRHSEDVARAYLRELGRRIDLKAASLA